MAEEGCIPALIESLRKGELSADSQEHAAMVLSCLCVDVSNHESIIERSGIGQLVALLSGDDKTAGAKKQGAMGLAQLAVYNADTQARIAKEGALPPLVGWLLGEDEHGGPPEIAAQALSAIARQNEPLQMRIAELGAIPPLVLMLSETGDIDLHIAASDGLATLARDVPTNQAEVAQAGGIPPIVALLSSSRRECQENASKAIAALAPDDNNKLQILKAGGIGPLVALLKTGNDQTQMQVAKGLESLARDIPEIQATLAQEGASGPLTALLGSDHAETQESAMAALLCMASHPDSRTTVVQRLVGVLLGKNTAAQLKAAQSLAVLASRSSLTRQIIVHAGAIAPLVGLLGNGQRADKNTPPERAAAVLADLSRISESKVEIPRAGGIGPLVTMLDSACEDAQTYAVCALRYLSVSADNKASIVTMSGIPRFVALLSSGTVEGQRHATHALWQVATSADTKTAIVQAGGIPPLVALMHKRIVEDEETSEQDVRSLAETKESVAAVLSELARSQATNRKAIVGEGAINPLVALISEGSPAAQKHGTCALWGLAQDPRYRDMIAEMEGAVERLVELLRDFEGETQGFAAATLVCIAQDDVGKEAILGVGGPGPLMTIALGPPNWLRSQSVEVLKLLGYSDPSEKLSEAPLSPRLMRYQAELCSNPAVWMMTEGPQKAHINDEHMADLARKMKVGDRVIVDPGSRLAEVRYVGKIPEIAPGYWIGVLYDQPVGKNDGAVKGRRCFECQAEFGGFLRPDHIHIDPEPPARRARTKEEEDAVEAAASSAAAEAAAAAESADPRSQNARRKRQADKSPKQNPNATPRSARANGKSPDNIEGWNVDEDAPEPASAVGSARPARSKSPEGDEDAIVPATARRKAPSAKSGGKERSSKEASPRSPKGLALMPLVSSPRGTGSSPRVAGSKITTPRATQEPPIASARPSMSRVRRSASKPPS